MAVDELILETGDNLLLETGGACDLLLLETSTGIPACMEFRAGGLSAFAGKPIQLTSQPLSGADCSALCGRPANVASMPASFLSLTPSSSAASSVSSTPATTALLALAGLPPVQVSAGVCTLAKSVVSAVQVADVEVVMTNAFGLGTGHGFAGQIDSVPTCAVSPFVAASSPVTLSAMPACQSSAVFSRALSAEVVSVGSACADLGSFGAATHQVSAGFACALASNVASVALATISSTPACQDSAAIGQTASAQMSSTGSNAVGVTSLGTAVAQVYSTASSTSLAPSVASSTAAAISATPACQGAAVITGASSAQVSSAGSNAVDLTFLGCPVAQLDSTPSSTSLAPSVASSAIAEISSTPAGSLAVAPAMTIAASLDSIAARECEASLGSIQAGAVAPQAASAVTVSSHATPAASLQSWQAAFVGVLNTAPTAIPVDSVMATSPTTFSGSCVAALVSSQSAAGVGLAIATTETIFVAGPILVRIILVGRDESLVNLKGANEMAVLLGRMDNEVTITGAQNRVDLDGCRDPLDFLGRLENAIELLGAKAMTIHNEIKPQYRGQDLGFSFQHKPAGSDPISILGWTFRFELLQEDTVMFTKSTGFDTYDAAGGKMQFDLDPGDTLALDAGDYDTRLWRADVGNEVVLADGVLKLL